jgi:proline iminopeptidase
VTPYPETEPTAHGLLDVGDGNRVYWETCGSDAGKPAVMLHGGPGSGCSPWHRRLFDPAAYRAVMIDQRNCGRSTPHAGDHDTDLTANTTAHLVADIERVRDHLGIERWLVMGGSWGSTLALAYAQSHPQRVSEMVLFGVTAGRRKEADWLFREGLQPLFPEQWERRRAALPERDRQGDVVAAYHRLLNDPDPEVRRRYAYEWCMWESATPTWPPSEGLSPRYADPRFALGFARLVTHYVHHDDFLEDNVLMDNIALLADTPAVLINGRSDMQAPLGTAWELSRRWPAAELVVVVGESHAAGTPGMAAEIVRATDRFAP